MTFGYQLIALDQVFTARFSHHGGAATRDILELVLVVWDVQVPAALCRDFLVLACATSDVLACATADWGIRVRSAPTYAVLVPVATTTDVLVHAANGWDVLMPAAIGQNALVSVVATLDVLVPTGAAFCSVFGYVADFSAHFSMVMYRNNKKHKTENLYLKEHQHS